MRIVAPYFVTEEAVHTYDTHDKVEREGYVSNEKKIDTFIQTGLVLQNMSITGGPEYEIQGGESDFEPDSPEYLEELTKDAENYNEKPLEQYMDKITAEEILSDADKTIETEKRTKKNKKKEVSFEDSIVSAITKGFDRIDKQPNKAESEPKN